MELYTDTCLGITYGKASNETKGYEIKRLMLNVQNMSCFMCDNKNSINVWKTCTADMPKCIKANKCFDENVTATRYKQYITLLSH